MLNPKSSTNKQIGINPLQPSIKSKALRFNPNTIKNVFLFFTSKLNLHFNFIKY